MTNQPKSLISHLSPLIIFLLIAPFTPWLDMAISGYFFHGHFQSNAFLSFMFDYGILPAWAAVFISVILWKKWRKAAYVLVLTLAIGSGLIVNVILKDHWGRPRPMQVVEFGGKQAFRPFYEPNFFHQPEPSKSFPCGHCSMGFFFFALALVARRHQCRSLYYGGMALALGLGILLSVVRIAQGGHFFSDALASALIMWYTAVILTAWIYRE